MRSWSLKGRLVAGMAAMLLPLIVVSVVTSYWLMTHVDNYRFVSAKAAQTMLPLDSVQAAIVDAKYELIVTTDGHVPEESAIAEHEQKINALLESLQYVDYIVQDEREFFTAMGLQIDMGFKALRSSVGLENHRDTWKSINEFSFRLDVAKELTEQIHKMVQADIMSKVNSFEGAERVIVMTILCSLLVAVVMASLIGRALGRSVYEPIRQLDDATRAISEDITYRLTPSGSDVFARLGRGFNSMAERLEKTIKELSEQATRDSLTGADNRRMFMVNIAAEMERSRRYGLEFSLLYLDLDHFKDVNDRYGHLVGDRVLRSFTEVVSGCLREIDKFARVGGEEFAIILPRTPKAGAVHVANRICDAVAKHSLRVGDDPVELLKVTCSAGVASYPAEGAGVDELIDSADSQLYMAKNSGRNRVFVDGKSTKPSSPSKQSSTEQSEVI